MPSVRLHLYQIQRKQKYWKQQIRHGHVGDHKVGVWKTIIATTEFPINETTSFKLKATVCTSFSTTGFTRLERLQKLGSFAVMFMFASCCESVFS